jgi:hypothetical protein
MSRFSWTAVRDWGPLKWKVAVCLLTVFMFTGMGVWWILLGTICQGPSVPVEATGRTVQLPRLGGFYHPVSRSIVTLAHTGDVRRWRFRAVAHSPVQTYLKSVERSRGQLPNQTLAGGGLGSPPEIGFCALPLLRVGHAGLLNDHAVSSGVQLGGEYPSDT